MHNRARLQGHKAAATDKLLVDNPIDRYKIGTDTKGLETAPDGSITIVISRDRPTGENASNWLPAPDGLFRTYFSKSSEEDNEAGELDKAEEVLSVVLPADEDATLPLYPGEEALDEPAPLVTA